MQTRLGWLTAFGVTGVETGDVAIVVAGSTLSERAGFPSWAIPTGWDFDPSHLYEQAVDQISASYLWPEQLWQDLVPMYDAATEIGTTRLHNWGVETTVVTTAIDGLFLNGESRVIEVNGSIREMVCPTCLATTIITDDDSLYVVTDEPPPCSECGRDVVPLVNVGGNRGITRILDDRMDLAMEQVSRLYRNQTAVFIAPDDSHQTMELIEVAAGTSARVIAVMLDDTAYQNPLFDSIISIPPSEI